MTKKKKYYTYYLKTNDNKFIPLYFIKPKKINKIKKFIIVIEEIFGVNENIKNVCKRLSLYNYFSIAPELFFRIKNLNFNQNINDLRKIIEKISDNQIISDINCIVSWIIKKFNTDKIGITGFCWGGRITWLYSYYMKNIKSGVAWYGRLINIKNNKHPIHPLDIGDKIKIPILGLYGEKDISIPKENVINMKKKIKKKKKCKIILYKEAEHGFYADYRQSYNKKIAEKAWIEMINWFNKYI